MNDGGESVVGSGGGRRRMDRGHEFRYDDGHSEGTFQSTFYKDKGCARSGTGTAADACSCSMDAGERAAVGGGGGGGGRRGKQEEEGGGGRRRTSSSKWQRMVGVERCPQFELQALTH
jgi:hypothetical protein